MEQSNIKRPWWRTLFKWTGIGCGGFFALMLLLAGIGSWLGPTPAPASLSTALPALDSSVATIALDTIVPPAAPAETVPVQSPVPVVQDTTPAPPPVKPEPKPKPKQAAVTVYTTRTGDHYHRSGCSSLRKSSYATTLDEARQGYEPCHRCNPPR